MTYIEAAIAVLEASPRPMTIAEIMTEVTRRKLVPITGQTPEQTLATALYRHLGKHPRLRHSTEQGRLRTIKGSSLWYLELVLHDEGP